MTAAIAVIAAASRRIPATIPHAVLALVLLVAVTPAAVAQTAPSTGTSHPFAPHTWHVETDTQALLEAWNYNGSHEETYGLAEGVTYGLRDGVALTLGQRIFYVSQRANDTWVLGLTSGLRARVFRRGRATGFVEGDVGISDAAIATPPRGTRFNYLAIGSAGVLVHVRPRMYVLAGLQLLHISNASLKGPGRNPDIEAIGPRVGIVLGF